MGFLKLIDKKKVPDELPALITEEIKKKTEETKLQDVKEEIKPEIKNQLEQKPEIKDLPESQIKQDTVSEKQIKIEKPNEEKIQIKKELTQEEKNYPKMFKDSFFIRLQENLSKEMSSLKGLEDWYNNRLLPEDSLSEMKNYWEKQKSNSAIQAIGNDFQDKIAKKIILLQELEKKWQDIYFELIEKEEDIKEQEKELKKMLAEFIGFCKKRMKNEKTKKNKEPHKKKRKSR